MNFLKKTILVLIMFFSFYYTDKIANYVLEKNKLYLEIKAQQEKYQIESKSVLINDDYMIPGLTGKKVDVKNSYYNMKDIKKFNPYYLVYKDIYPQESFKKYPNKIINKGNKLKNSIAIVVEYDQDIINYLKNYKISVLTKLNNYQKDAKYEQINDDFNNYQKLTNLIKRYNNNSNICFVNKNNLKFCQKNRYILVAPTKVLDNNSYLKIINHLESGDIILIRKSTKLSNVNLILKNILYKDYQINYLSKHINEKRD